MTKNTEKLQKTLQKHGAVRMLLMLATADDCKKIIEITFQKNETLAKQAKSFIEHLNWDSMESADLDKIAGLVTQVMKDVNFPKSATQHEKIRTLEMSLKKNVTDEITEILSTVSSDSDIPEGISTTDADTLVLWSAVQTILSEIPICSVNIRASTGYRLPGKKIRTATGKTQGILETLANTRAGHHRRLSKDEKNVLTGLVSMIEREAMQSNEAITSGSTEMKNASIEAFCRDTTNKISKNHPWVLSLVRNFINNQPNQFASMFDIKRYVSYRVLYKLIGDEFDRADIKEKIVLKYLRTTKGVSKLFINPNPSEVDMNLALNELGVGANRHRSNLKDFINIDFEG